MGKKNNNNFTSVIKYLNCFLTVYLFVCLQGKSDSFVGSQAVQEARVMR